MTFSRRKIGKEFEDMAASFLEERGYRILERNFHARFGEIDLVAEEGDSLVFVEVRMRSQRGFVSPFESLTSRKLRALWTAGECYLAEHETLHQSVRFDVVGIFRDNGKIRFEIMRNVLEEGLL